MPMVSHYVYDISTTNDDDDDDDNNDDVQIHIYYVWNEMFCYHVMNKM